MGEVCSSPRGPHVCQLPKDPRSCLHRHCNATPPVIPPVLWDPLKDFIHGLTIFSLGSPQKRIGFPRGTESSGVFRISTAEDDHAKGRRSQAHGRAARPLHPAGSTPRAVSPLARAPSPYPAWHSKRRVTDLERQRCPPETAPSQLSFKGHPEHLLHNLLTTRH